MAVHNTKISKGSALSWWYIARCIVDESVRISYRFSLSLHFTIITCEIVKIKAIRHFLKNTVVYEVIAYYVKYATE